METVIFHENCSCFSEGFIQDAFYAQQECAYCGEVLGFGQPVTVSDGCPYAHAECEVIQEALADPATWIEGPGPLCECSHELAIHIMGKRRSAVDFDDDECTAPGCLCVAAKAAA